MLRVLPHLIVMDYNYTAIEYIPILVFSAGFLRWIRSLHLGLDWLHAGPLQSVQLVSLIIKRYDLGLPFSD